MLYEHYLLLDFKSCDSRNILTRVLVQLILLLLHEHIQNINHFTFNPLLDNQFHVVRVWFCGCKKCIFNKLILLKIEFNVKWFMLIYIYVKMSWIINSNVKITLTQKLQVRINSENQSNRSCKNQFYSSRIKSNCPKHWFWINWFHRFSYLKAS